MISDELRKEFASGILISDVNLYIDTNKSKYEEWQKQRKKEQKKKGANKNESKKGVISIKKS